MLISSNSQEGRCHFGKSEAIRTQNVSHEQLTEGMWPRRGHVPSGCVYKSCTLQFKSYTCYAA